VRVDVVLVAGETFYIWGGEEPFQTVSFGGRQLNLQGEELGALLRHMALQTVEPDGAANGSRPIRAETNSTSSAAGSRR